MLQIVFWKSILFPWRWPDKRAEPFVLSLIFLLLFVSRQKVRKQKTIWLCIRVALKHSFTLQQQKRMSTGLTIEKKNYPPEIKKPGLPQQPAAIKFIAKFISYIFHPVFVPVYIVLFMVYIHPYLFAGFSEWDKTRVVLMALLMFAFFPANGRLP